MQSLWVLLTQESCIFSYSGQSTKNCKKSRDSQSWISFTIANQMHIHYAGILMRETTSCFHVRLENVKVQPLTEEINVRTKQVNGHVKHDSMKPEIGTDLFFDFHQSTSVTVQPDHFLLNYCPLRVTPCFGRICPKTWQILA